MGFNNTKISYNYNCESFVYHNITSLFKYNLI